MGKTDLCKHLGTKVTDGNVLRGNRLVLCKDCGKPLIESVLDVVAYITKPRRLVNGKVVRSYPTIFGKFEFLLENIYFLNRVAKHPRGREPSFDFETESYVRSDRSSGGFSDEPPISPDAWEPNDEPPISPEEPEAREPPYPEKIGTGRMPGKTYIALYKWAYKIREVYSKMEKTFYEIIKCSPEKIGVYSQAQNDARSFLRIMAKACLKLNKQQIKTVYACCLVENGLICGEAVKICGVNYRTINRWRPFVKAFLKKTTQLEFLTVFPPIPEEPESYVMAEKIFLRNFLRIWGMTKEAEKQAEKFLAKIKKPF